MSDAAAVPQPSNPSVRSVTEEALRNLLAAWDALPKGNYPGRAIELWLEVSMKPAFDNARAVLDLFQSGQEGSSEQKWARVVWRDGRRTMEDRPAYWTHDDEAFEQLGEHFYYFAPVNTAPPPYTKQRNVEAIIDIADDGTLAGVELIDNMPPPPSHAKPSPASQEGMKLVPVEPSQESYNKAPDAPSLLKVWLPVESAPKDGTWFLLRGRNAAGIPMVPVVAAWCPAGSRHHGLVDSASFKSVDFLAADIGADWTPLSPSPAKGQSKDGGWRTIETAPKDGTPLLLTHWPDDGMERPASALPVISAHWSLLSNEWFSWRGGGGLNPTHWMPLPEPPRQIESGGNQ